MMSEITNENISSFLEPVSQNSCGTDHSFDETVRNYKYYCDGLLVSIIGCLGIMGNLFSIFVLSKPKLQDCFHRLLLTLACFDTIYIIIGGLNYTFKSFEVSSDAYTISFPFIIYPITNISLCGTIFMTVAISIERFLGICYPLHLPPQNRKAWYYVIPVTLLSIVVNLPKFFEADIEWLKEDVSILTMNMSDISLLSLSDFEANTPHGTHYDYLPILRPTDIRKDSNYIKFYVTYCRMFFTVIIPFIALLTINLKIIADLNKLKSKPFGSQRKLWKEVNMFMVLLSIVIIFICCNTPRTIIDIWEFYHLEAIVKCNDLLMKKEIDHPFLPEKWIECLTHISHFTAILNSSINFLIYCVVGHNFRKELLSTLGIKRNRSQVTTELTMSLKMNEAC